MKYIKLTNGSIALVDDEDFDWISKFNWYFLKANRSDNGYAYTTKKGMSILMHRLIMNTPKGLFTDHINRNKLDNRKENLRIVTPSENNLNTKLKSTNTSGYRGVTFHKEKRKFMSQLSFNNNYFFLGYFDNPKDASRAYEEKLGQIHGL